MSLSWLVFYVTCNGISVIYVTAQMCRRTEEEVVRTYGRAPNAIDISQGSFTCPSYTDTWLPFLYVDSDTSPHLVAHYDTLGIRRTYSQLQPPGVLTGGGGSALVHVYIWEHRVSLNYRILWWIFTKLGRDKMTQAHLYWLLGKIRRGVNPGQDHNRSMRGPSPKDFFRMEDYINKPKV